MITQKYFAGKILTLLTGFVSIRKLKKMSSYPQLSGKNAFFRRRGAEKIYRSFRGEKMRCMFSRMMPAAGQPALI